MTGRIVLAVAPGTAERAVDTAFALAAERGSDLLAVRTWHDPDLPLGGWLQPDRTAHWDAAHANARGELDHALERGRAAHPAVHVTPLVVDDDLVPFLTALSTRADLLVVGRSTQLGRRASPVDTLVRRSACPVLVVPPARRAPKGRMTLAAAGSLEQRDGMRRTHERPAPPAIVVELRGDVATDLDESSGVLGAPADEVTASASPSVPTVPRHPVSDGAPWAGAAPLTVWGVNVLDDLRRSTGLVLDVMGHVPRTSPSVVTAPAPGVRLHSYPGADPDGPPVLLIPAPIKRSYVFDLDPGSSVVNRCRCLDDPCALATYMRVVRWTLDEFRQPQQLFTDVVDRLYRRDEFAAGTLTVAGRTVGPADLVAPVLTVVAPHSQVVPPSAVLPVHASFAASEKQVLEYGGDTGVVVQHLGVLVGRNAHRILWPRILAWLDSATAATAVERRR